MKKYAIIVAGGSGSRMQSATPKQFLAIAGKPMLMHTIEKFFAADGSPGIIVVLPPSEAATWKTLCTTHAFSVPHQVAEGGATRFHSVLSGLALVPDDCLVAVHDGVRPLVSAALIDRCFAAAEAQGSAIPFIPVPESVRQGGSGAGKAIDRQSLMLIQTPQCFASSLLKKAYRQEYNPAFTDDATVVEAAGSPVSLVQGERENIKITFPSDLLYAEALLGGGHKKSRGV